MQIGWSIVPAEIDELERHVELMLGDRLLEASSIMESLKQGGIRRSILAMSRSHSLKEQELQPKYCRRGTPKCLGATAYDKSSGGKP
jgi:hypothetical protein